MHKIDKMFLVTLGSLLATVMAIFVEIITPEMRCWFGLESCLANQTNSNTAVIPPTRAPINISDIEPLDLSEILNPTRGKFEKTTQYQLRRLQLLEDFNRSMLQPDSDLQVGVALLKDYNPDREILFVHLKWETHWVKQFVGTFTFSKYGIMKVSPSEAQVLWQTGKQKPFFVNIDRVKNRLKGKGVLVEGEQTWFIHLIPLPEMIMIPAGQFQMGDLQGTGDYDEKPVHTVSINRFEMSCYEVTFEEYDYFAEVTGRTKPYDNGWGRERHPVINVDWEDIMAYIEWLNQLTGDIYRLPTEAEWEYAARAGTTTYYDWGNQIDSNKANCDGCQSRWDNQQTAPVGSFAHNSYGLYDMVGNVWEWTCSNYEEKYSGWELHCGSKRHTTLGVIRGGSWLSYPKNVRIANRSKSELSSRQNYVGFRIVRELLPEKNFKAVANDSQSKNLSNTQLMVGFSNAQL